MKLEIALLGLFLVCWAVGVVALLGGLSLAGSLDLGLYGLYSIAAAAGWLSGNIYLQRSRGYPRDFRRRLLLIYLVGPPGLLLLLRMMASREAQLAAPIVPSYAMLVFAVFFLVPVSLRGIGTAKR